MSFRSEAARLLSPFVTAMTEFVFREQSYLKSQFKLTNFIRRGSRSVSFTD